MKALFLLAAAGAAFVTFTTGCQQPSGNTGGQTADSISTTHTVPDAAALQNGLQCFTQVVGKDTARLQLQVNNDSIGGKLEYRRYEKDSNTGDIKGTFHDNIIDVQYHFMSEGVMSTTPAVFKLEGEQLFEGRASSFDKEGRPVFDKDPARIQFDSIPFVKTPCP